MSQTGIGIDIGGSGIKSALVDVTTGELLTERKKVKTPSPATPEAVAEVVKDMVADHDDDAPVGVGFPAVVRQGVARTAMNIDEAWIGRNVVSLLAQAAGRDVAVVNDADAAAVAEGAFGTAIGIQGLVIVVTFGTGIGSGFLFDGALIPNVELGALELDGYSPAETHFSARARTKENLDWSEWGRRANRFLAHVDRVFTPDLIVVGGGVAKRWERYADELDPALPLEPAQMKNNAGLIGAAIVATR